MKEKIRNGFDSIPQLEKDGTVHHLGIDHSQIGEGVILTSNLERVERIKDRFEDAKREAFHREYITYTGTYRGVRMSAMSIGNGCMPTEIAVEELRHIGCNRMIKVGSCYAIDPDIRPGDIFVPQGACRCEGATLEYVNIQYPAVSDLDSFFALLQSAKEKGIEVKTGIIRTHDGLFLESPFAHEGVKERIAPWQKVGVACVDNECATMFTVASILQMKAGCIYVVTDNLETGEAMDYEKDYENKIDQIIDIAAEAMKKLIKGEEYEI